MRAQSPSRRLSFIGRLTPWHRRVAVMFAVAAILATWSGSHPAQAGDPRVERAQEQRRVAQQKLDVVLARLTDVEADVSAAEARVAELTARQQAARQEAEQASSTLAHLARASYEHGTVDPALALFASESPGEAMAQLQMLGLMAERSQVGYESASAAGVRIRVTGEAAEKAAETLKERRAELEAVRREAGSLLAAAEQQEESARSEVARERAAREARATRQQQAARERASRSAPPAPVPSAPAAAPAATSGGIACPVGQPRSYSDTYGAPRSGGRAHRGTDILAPRGTPIYAYENGTITRTNSNRLGGISLYLRGDGGNQYYYTHLQGYVGGLSAGQRVQGGQQIGYNGDTGNARGIPHLHFEVMPGGGGNVNPYPYVLRACG